jgi:hypothetical protein
MWVSVKVFEWSDTLPESLEGKSLKKIKAKITHIYFSGSERKLNENRVLLIYANSTNTQLYEIG